MQAKAPRLRREATADGVFAGTALGSGATGQSRGGREKPEFAESPASTSNFGKPPGRRFERPGRAQPRKAGRCGIRPQPDRPDFPTAFFAGSSHPKGAALADVPAKKGRAARYAPLFASIS